MLSRRERATGVTLPVRLRALPQQQSFVRAPLSRVERECSSRHVTLNSTRRVRSCRANENAIYYEPNGSDKRHANKKHAHKSIQSFRRQQISAFGRGFVRRGNVFRGYRYSDHRCRQFGDMRILNHSLCQSRSDCCWHEWRLIYDDFNDKRCH